MFLVLSEIFLNIVQHHVLWGPILESDLKRFNAYAFRVRRYYCQWHGAGDDVDISAYVHVLRASRRSYIFPRLLDLDVIEAYKDGANTTKIMFLMSPCLHKFSMSGSSTSTAIVLNSLQITTPHILCLTLRGVAFIDHDVSVICSLSQLQEISIFEDNRFERKSGRWGGEPALFDLSFFSRLSCKKTLRKFSLHWLYIIQSDSSIWTVEFPSLESIDLSITTIGPIADFFCHVMVPGLKELSIGLGSSPFGKLIKSTEAQYWNQFFDVIAVATTTHFKNLKIAGNRSVDFCECWKGVGLTVSGFPDFSNLSLETFSIKWPLCSLGQSDLEKVIHSWPYLSTLALASCWPSELDLMVLVDIAIGLPHLKSLYLSVNKLQCFNQRASLLNHNLQYLFLETFVFVMEFELAQCINQIFPHLKNCIFSYHSDLGWISEDVTSLVQSAEN